MEADRCQSGAWTGLEELAGGLWGGQIISKYDQQPLEQDWAEKLGLLSTFLDFWKIKVDE